MKFDLIREQYPEAPLNERGFFEATCPVCEHPKFTFRAAVKKDGTTSEFAEFSCWKECAKRDLRAALGEREAGAYIYADANGEPVAVKVRFEYDKNIDPDKGKPKKDFVWYRVDADGKRASKPGLGGVKPSLYHIEEVLAGASSGAVVFVVEGEKKADRLRAATHMLEASLPVTAGSFGAVNAEQAKAFAGASRVIVLADNDEAGRSKAAKSAKAIAPIVADVRVIEKLPGFEDRAASDVEDFLAAGGTVEQLLELADEVPAFVAPSSADSSTDEDGRQSAATRLCAMVEKDFELYADASKPLVRYADERLPSGQRVTHNVESEEFADRLASRFFRQFKKAPDAATVATAIGYARVLAGEGPKRHLFPRVARGDDGAIYVDLWDATWRAVRIDATGWTIVNDPPVRFRRKGAGLPFPEPVKGGRLAELRDFLSVEDQHWPLLAGWLVMSMHPEGPYPVLNYVSNHGSGKSTAVRVTAALVDPHAADLRQAPRNIDDLFVAAENGWCLPFDNLSYLPREISDAFCVLATGGSLTKRAHYENDAEHILRAKRPVVFTSIKDVITALDLLDRAVTINLEPISEDQRKTEAQFIADFEAARPRLFGALLDAVSLALRRYDDVRASNPPLTRMADFEMFARAAEPAFGVAPGAFAEAYRKSREEAEQFALDGSPLAKAVIWAVDVKRKGEFEGTASELLDLINYHPDAEEQKRDSKSGWPKAANKLSGSLAQLEPALKGAGYAVDLRFKSKDGSRRLVRIAKSDGAAARTYSEPGDDGPAF